MIVFIQIIFLDNFHKSIDKNDKFEEQKYPDLNNIRERSQTQE